MITEVQKNLNIVKKIPSHVSDRGGFTDDPINNHRLFP